MANANEQAQAQVRPIQTQVSQVPQLGIRSLSINSSQNGNSNKLHRFINKYELISTNYFDTKKFKNFKKQIRMQSKICYSDKQGK